MANKPKSGRSVFRETTDAELVALERGPGRPSLGPGKGRRGGRIAYRVDAETLRAAEAAAKAEGRGVGTVARAALTMYLQRARLLPPPGAT